MQDSDERSGPAIADATIGIKVALVEDDAGLRRSLERMLNLSPGFRCSCSCGSGEEALKLIPRNPPDIVLMDIHLPNRSGIECTVLLRQQLPQLQVIMLTVYEDTDNIFNALAAGAAGYLLKRTTSAELIEAMEQPVVFVHRDYHSRNLMVLDRASPGILDFQDAVRGAVTYDLVSLYKDCYVTWPRARVLGWVEDYRGRAIAAGLPLPDAATFLRWFDLMGLQRHLKVLGIFARLWYRDAKPSYLADLPTVLAYVRQTAAAYAEFGDLARLLDELVEPRFPAAQARAGAA